MSVEAILLDLGNVLLRFDWTRAVRRLSPDHALDAPAFVALLDQKLDYLSYEAGRVETDDFMRRLRDVIGFQGSDEALHHSYSDIFTEMPERRGLVDALKPHYRLAIVSNTSAVHVTHFETEHPWLREVGPRFYSCAVKALKPNAEYYEAVIAGMGLPAEKMVFVDDRADNCAGAASCGLQALHVGPDEDLAVRLREVGVEVEKLQGPSSKFTRQRRRQRRPGLQ